MLLCHWCLKRLNGDNMVCVSGDAQRECAWPQAEDRAHRIGQKKEVLVLVLVSAGTIEQVILDRAQQKKEIDAKVIQVDPSHRTHEQVMW